MHGFSYPNFLLHLLGLATTIIYSISVVAIRSEDKRNLLNAKLLAKKPARILKHTLEVLQEKVYYLGKTQAKSRAEIQDNVELGFQLKRREVRREE